MDKPYPDEEPKLEAIKLRTVEDLNYRERQIFLFLEDLGFPTFDHVEAAAISRFPKMSIPAAVECFFQAFLDDHKASDDEMLAQYGSEHPSFWPSLVDIQTT